KFNSFKVNVGVAGSTKKFYYNVGYTNYTSNGISEAKDPTGKNNFDNDGLTQKALQANFGIHPTDMLSIKPFVRYNYFQGKYDAGAFTDDTKDKSTSTLLNFGTSAQYQLTKGVIHFLYGYDQSNRTYDDTYGKYDYKGRFNQVELFFNYDLTKQIQFLGGASQQWFKMLDTTATEKNPKTTLTSPYLSVFLHNTGGFTMEVGGRYNQHSKYGNTFTYSFNPSYILNNSLKIFFNYSTGFRAPSLNQLYGQYGANPDLKAETSNNIESGFQFFTSDKKINIRAVAFKRQIKDVIIYTSAGRYSNFDQQKDYGFEIEPSVNVAKKITIKAFYAFVTGQVKTQVAGRDTTYNNLLRRPKNSMGVNVGYQINPKLYVSINLKTFSVRNDMYFDLNSFTNQSASLSGYQLLDAYGEYKFLKGNLNLFAQLKNLLNQDYMEVYGYNTMRFNAVIGVKVKF
ncbi:MAG TPA: TonB-dependent receptor, partial [Cytophagales bacterium]|nr:TonB-dependent receptor [Cytophagales bacterium]